MKILDRTPYRAANGQVDILGRIRGTLQYGLTWFPGLQAQDAVIVTLEKVLKDGFVLTRNATLPDTEINLPLVLIAPQGVFLINVVHERGVYRAKDEEWGTVMGERFVPAAVNQIQRTMKLARVLQVYLDRAGFKDQFVVEPLIMSADPGTHIDSTRPAVRIIMSDALERFAISLGQGRALLNAGTVFKVTKAILEGPEPKAEAVAAVPVSVNAPAAGSAEEDDGFAFSFAEDSDRQPASTGGFEEDRFQDSGFSDSGFRDEPLQENRSNNAGAQPAFAQPSAQPAAPARAKTPAPKKKGPLGLTLQQSLLLAAILLFWLCSIVAFIAYINLS